MTTPSLIELGRKPRVAFADFWPWFKNHDNIFQQVLTQRLGAEVVEDPVEADVLIYSVFGDTQRSFNGTKVFYTGESVLPRWSECDYALTFMRDGIGKPERHLRLPYWVHEEYVRRTGRIEQFSTKPQDILSRHQKFCNFVYSNSEAKERAVFMEKLSRYRHVDSAGRFLNNTGVHVQDKVAYCSRYKFTIAFENYPSRGYLTEKLPDAFAAGSLPIYWGDPDVSQDFNPRRFVHARDFRDYEELVDHIRFLDENDEAYLSYFQEPLFLKNQKSVDDYKDELDLFFRKVLSSGYIRDKDEEDGVPHGIPLRYNLADMARYDDGKLRGEDSEKGQSLCAPGDALGLVPLQMAACLSSYKRVEDFLRQILCLMNQSYPHLHVFAALKGVARSVAEELIFPYVQQFIDEGKLTLRLFPNKDQFSNFLDTVRGLDVSGYDLFAKIDDDDFYDRDYFQHLHDFHATLPPGYSSCHRAPGFFFQKCEGMPMLTPISLLCLGPGQVLSRRVMEKLLDMEANPVRLKDALTNCRKQTGYGKIGFAEDQFFKAMMLEHGCGNIGPWLEQRGIKRHLTIHYCNASVVRGGSLPPDFESRNWDVFSEGARRYEYVFDFIHPEWRGSVRLYDGKAMRLDHSGVRGEVVCFSEKELVLKWDDLSLERFVADPSGEYRFQPGIEEESECPSEPDCSETVSAADASSADDVISLKHNVWADQLRIRGNRAHRVNSGDAALIAARDEMRILLDWDSWDKEEFVLRNDGHYYFSPYTCQDSDTNASEEWIIDLFDRPDKSWLAHMGRPALRFRYAAWDMLLRMEDMCRDALAALERRPMVKRILLVGICKDCLAALHIALELKRRSPQLEIGVLGCPWPGDCSTLESRSGLLWSSSDSDFYRQGLFDSLFRRYADPVVMWMDAHKEHLNIRGYSFYGEKKAFSFDRECTKRVEPFLCKMFTTPLDETSESKDPHHHVSFFQRKHPAVFQRMIDLLFEDLRHPEPEGECVRYAVGEDGTIEQQK